jgi:hypothetical protein
MGTVCSDGGDLAVKPLHPNMNHVHHGSILNTDRIQAVAIGYASAARFDDDT